MATSRDGITPPPNTPRIITSIARLRDPAPLRLDAAPDYPRVITSIARPRVRERRRLDLDPNYPQGFIDVVCYYNSRRPHLDLGPEFALNTVRLFDAFARLYDSDRAYLDFGPPQYREVASNSEATLVLNTVPSFTEAGLGSTSYFRKLGPGGSPNMAFGPVSLAGLTVDAPDGILYSAEALRLKAAWLRDDLDEKISRDGPMMLGLGDAFMVNNVLFKLLSHKYTADDLRWSGIHKAVIHIAGKGTRWPPQIVEVCDELVKKWEHEHGELKRLTPILWEGKGRLDNIVPVNFTKEKDMLTHWMNTNAGRTDHHYPHRLGHIGLTPGDWWLDPTLAYYDGVITVDTLRGGIVADYNTVYAIVLRDDAEVHSPDPNIIRFRCDMLAWGRRQMSNNHRHLRTIRVFRDHALKSLCAPISGFRYEGLYRIFATYTKSDNSRSRSERYSLSIMQQFDLVREPQSSLEPGVEQVLKRPNAAERDDMAEFKRVMWVNRKIPTGLSLEEANALRFPAASK